MLKGLFFASSIALWCLSGAQTENALPGNANAGAEAAAGEPQSTWGSYYMLDKPIFEKFFQDVFVKFIFSSDAARSKCKALNDIDYSRYYKNNEEEDKYILSYFCMKSRGYEHIVATGNRVDGGFFTDPKYVSFSENLAGLRVFGAGDYEGEPLEGEEEEAKVESLFDEVRDEVTKNLPSGCSDPSFSTDFELLTKEENDLQYYKFPVACTMNEPNDMFTDVEVFQDIKYGKVNGGNVGLVGFHGLAPNTVYHTRKEKEMEAALQSGSNLAMASIFSLVMVPAAMLAL